MSTKFLLLCLQAAVCFSLVVSGVLTLFEIRPEMWLPCYPVNDLVEGNFGKNKHNKSYLQDPKVLQSAQEPETYLVSY